MTSAYDLAVKLLKQLPGLGFRSAERIALHLFAEHPEKLQPLLDALTDAGQKLRRCTVCGNLAEDELCVICADNRRDESSVCVVETVPDLLSLERAGVFKGRYHVLHGKLSPLHGIGPDQLNIGRLQRRIDEGQIRELILALSNDIEGEATCHYLQETLVSSEALHITRIGFGLPSGGGLGIADPVTLKSALEGRRSYH